MALYHSPPKDKTLQAIDFSLKNIDGTFKTLSECKGPKGILVMFICNHCPYVQAIIERLVQTCKELQTIGYGCVAIMPNDTENYPADSFENMKIFAEKQGFTFPYLIDETQKVAASYGAVCTPDFFAFDAGMNLRYRGRLDSAGAKEAQPDTKPELLDALTAMAMGRPEPENQHPSMGCSIKWRR